MLEMEQSPLNCLKMEQPRRKRKQGLLLHLAWAKERGIPIGAGGKATGKGANVGKRRMGQLDAGNTRVARQRVEQTDGAPGGDDGSDDDDLDGGDGYGQGATGQPDDVEAADLEARIRRRANERAVARAKAAASQQLILPGFFGCKVPCRNYLAWPPLQILAAKNV